MEGCRVGGVSGGVQSEMREGREGGSTGCGGDPVMNVGKYEVGSGVTCEYTVGGVEVWAVPDESGERS